VLPGRHRLLSSRDFGTAVRSGRRIRVGGLVAHVWLPRSETTRAEPRVGLIVSKRIGSAVQRHRVSRVLRHAAAAHVGELPAGTVVVLRALPGAAERDSRLAADVATIFERAGAP
jgi:ribonuclease P protein component